MKGKIGWLYRGTYYYDDEPEEPLEDLPWQFSYEKPFAFSFREVKQIVYFEVEES